MGNDQHSKIRLSVRPGQPKSRRTTKNTDVVVRRTTINFHAPAVKLYPICLVPSIRTTRNCNLVVRGTTIYFSLIRTLVMIIILLRLIQGWPVKSTWVLTAQFKLVKTRFKPLSFAHLKVGKPRQNL